SGDSLAFDRDTFDAVTAIEVLEHVADLDTTIDEIHRVLVPGGRLLLTSPNQWFPFETHGVLLAGRRLPPWSVPGLPWVSPLHRRMSDARVFTVPKLTRQMGMHGLGRRGYAFIMPPFDQNRVGRRLRPVVDRVERSPMAFTGMA